MLFKNISVDNPGGNDRADDVLLGTHMRAITQWECGGAALQGKGGEVRSSP